MFDQDKSLALPFCSVRCQQIDLKRWLGEEYSLPDDRPQSNTEEDEAE
jgi:hypothetical protein